MAGRKGLHTMSEVPSGSWDSRYLENFADHAGFGAGGTGAADAGAGAGTGGNGPDRPDGADVHAWYTRGLELLGKGSAAAATAEPGSRSVREALARAQFDTGRYAEAADNFRVIVEASPSDDYAHFGLGLALARSGDHKAAAEYLALAAAMRPDRKPYTDALRQVRATLAARKRTAE
jgi:tetratricopeptide (TPR) repeat protein